MNPCSVLFEDLTQALACLRQVREFKCKGATVIRELGNDLQDDFDGLCCEMVLSTTGSASLTLRDCHFESVEKETALKLSRTKLVLVQPISGCTSQFAIEFNFGSVKELLKLKVLETQQMV